MLHRNDPWWVIWRKLAWVVDFDGGWTIRLLMVLRDLVEAICQVDSNSESPTRSDSGYLCVNCNLQLTPTGSSTVPWAESSLLRGPRVYACFKEGLKVQRVRVSRLPTCYPTLTALLSGRLGTECQNLYLNAFGFLEGPSDPSCNSELQLGAPLQPVPGRSPAPKPGVIRGVHEPQRCRSCIVGVSRRR